MKRSIFALFSERAAVENVIEQLKASGIAPEGISVLFAESPGAEPSTKAPEGTATGGTAGFVLGGILGWLAGIGSLAIPGLGPFIAAGPIMAALSGAAVGAAIGGIAGALVGMGIPEYEARHYEAQLREGKLLLSVHTEGGEPVEHVLAILRASKAEEIATSGEAGAPLSSQPPVIPPKNEPPDLPPDPRKGNDKP
ncbi:MAG: hypothetical protein PHQ12_09900 [Chthoniobacteraceae bacterium]|nr:hypothetical protein [Chthoniobacteraceae bacterium]